MRPIWSSSASPIPARELRPNRQYADRFQRHMIGAQAGDACAPFRHKAGDRPASATDYAIFKYSTCNYSAFMIFMNRSMNPPKKAEEGRSRRPQEGERRDVPIGPDAPLRYGTRRAARRRICHRPWVGRSPLRHSLRRATVASGGDIILGISPMKTDPAQDQASCHDLVLLSPRHTDRTARLRVRNGGTQCRNGRSPAVLSIARVKLLGYAMVRPVYCKRRRVRACDADSSPPGAACCLAAERIR